METINKCGIEYQVYDKEEYNEIINENLNVYFSNQNGVKILGNIKVKSIISVSSLECGGSLVCGSWLVCGDSLKCGGSLECGGSLVCGSWLVCGDSLKCGDSLECGGSLKCGDSLECGSWLVCGSWLECGKYISVIRYIIASTITSGKNYYIFAGIGYEKSENSEAFICGKKIEGEIKTGIKIDKDYNPQIILNIKNLELRRKVFEIVGYDALMKNAELIDDNTKSGKVYQTDIQDEGESICLWQGICPSSNRQYIERIPPEIRTAEGARAWAWDITNDKFNKET